MSECRFWLFLAVMLSPNLLRAGVETLVPPSTQPLEAGSQPLMEIDAGEQRARELNQNGRMLYREGRYDDAIAAWEEGYRISRRTAFLYNIANALERLGRLPQALESLNRCRAFAPASEQESLARRIHTLEMRIESADVPLTTPVARPGDVRDPLPASRPSSSPPVSVENGLKATHRTPAISSRMGQRYARLGVVVGGALAVGGGVTATVIWARSLTWINQNDEQHYEQWRPWNNSAIALAGLGAALAITGAVIEVRSHSAAATSGARRAGEVGITLKDPRIVVGPGRDGWWVEAGWRF